MNKVLELAQDKFLDNLGRMSDVFGLNGFVAKLFGVLYLTGKPLSLDELAQALGASKGNVSINIRILENWGAVRKVWIKGSRKDFYEAEADVRKVLSAKVKSAVEKRISEVSKMIEEVNSLILSANGELTEEENRIANDYLTRLKKIEEIRNLVSNGLNLANKLF